MIPNWAQASLGLTLLQDCYGAADPVALWCSCCDVVLLLRCHVAVALWYCCCDVVLLLRYATERLSMNSLVAYRPQTGLRQNQHRLEQHHHLTLSFSH